MNSSEFSRLYRGGGAGGFINDCARFHSKSGSSLSDSSPFPFGSHTLVTFNILYCLQGRIMIPVSDSTVKFYKIESARFCEILRDSMSLFV